MQNLQIIMPTVDLRLADQRRLGLERLREENETRRAQGETPIYPRYPLLGTPDEFNIHKGDLLFTNAKLITGAAGLTTVYNPKGGSTGVFASMNGLTEDDKPVISCVAATEFFAGDSTRSGTNQDNISGIVHGTTSVPCSDPMAQVGDTLIWEYPAAGESTDPNIPNTVGVNASGRAVATVRALKPLGESRDSYPVRIRDAMMGRLTHFKDFDEKVKVILEAIDTRNTDRMRDAIARVFNRSVDEIKANVADLLPAGAGSPPDADAQNLAMQKFAFLKIVQLSHQVDADLKERIVGKATEAPQDGRIGISFRLP